MTKAGKWIAPLLFGVGAVIWLGWFGLAWLQAAAIVGFVFGSILLQGLKNIPADPPHVASVTRFGEQTREVKQPGWRFFFLYPFVQGAILIDMRNKNKDLVPQDVRTPDLAELEMPVSVTFTPDPKHLIEYVQAGKEDGAFDILQDMIEECTRQWAISRREGPQTWGAALAANEEAVSVILKRLVGEDVSPDMSLSAARGAADIGIPSLGIRLNRLNIKKIRPKGDLAKAAELRVKEEAEREGERVELHHVGEQIARLQQAKWKERRVEIRDGKPVEVVAEVDGPGLTREQALDLALVERGKMDKRTHKQITWDVGPNAGRAAETFSKGAGGSILSALAAFLTGKTDKKDGEK